MKRHHRYPELNQMSDAQLKITVDALSRLAKEQQSRLYHYRAELKARNRRNATTTPQ